MQDFSRMGSSELGILHKALDQAAPLSAGTESIDAD
jgi:hypothetical protein